MRARLVVGAVAAVLTFAACAPGTPDIVYSPSGSVPIGSAPGAGPVQVVARADGGALATGSSARPLTRVLADGTVDTTWGSALPNDCVRVSRAVAAGTGTLVTCSHLVNGSTAWQIWRVTAAGTLDPAFGGGDGIVDAPATINELDVAPLPNGGVFGLGYQVLPPSRTSVAPLVALVYSPAGALLSSTPIAIPLPIPELPVAFEGWFISTMIEPTANGVASFQRLAARVNNNGLEDALTRVQHFDADGVAVDAPAFLGAGLGLVARYEVPDFTPMPDGRYAFVATITTLDFNTMQSATEHYLRMQRADGTNDPGFGGGNAVRLGAVDSRLVSPTALVSAHDGRYLVVAGGPVTGPVTARFDAATGAVDPTYGNAGVAGVALRHVDALTVRAGVNQLYVGGTDTAGRPAVARIWNQLLP